MKKRKPNEQTQLVVPCRRGKHQFQAQYSNPMSASYIGSICPHCGMVITSLLREDQEEGQA